MSGWTTEWRLYRARYTYRGRVVVTEHYVARSIGEVRDVQVSNVGPDEDAPDDVLLYAPDERVTLRGDEGERLAHTADEWAVSVARPECISSSEA